LLIRRIPIHTFRHFDAAQVAELVTKNCSRSKIPVIVTDGWCPACGNAAPLQQYTTIVKPLNGWVIIDDTQAFGILGAGTRTTLPYGKGGGGLLQWQSVRSTTIITMVSLAKGFGAPLSVISGTRTFIKSFEQHSQTRVNSSPVSLAHLQAAMNAFHINQLEGDTRRGILWRNICLFRSLVQNAGIAVQGGIFPVQTIPCRSRRQTIWLWETLKKKKIRTVLITPHDEQQPVLSFIFRSDHQPREIQALAEIVKKYPSLFKPFDYVNTITGNINRTGSTQNATR
jgi:8-amino-7-oxononanoate synthase